MHSVGKINCYWLLGLKQVVHIVTTGFDFKGLTNIMVEDPKVQYQWYKNQP
jgi:hypothetical protein